jgi:arginine exporter protein ArgO
VLVVGLVIVISLFYVGVIASDSSWYVSLGLGAFELAAAWIMRPAAEARVLRTILAVFGTIMLLMAARSLVP